MGASIYNFRSGRGEGGKQLICDSDKGERGSKNPKILRTSYLEAPFKKLIHVLWWNLEFDDNKQCSATRWTNLYVLSNG